MHLFLLLLQNQNPNKKLKQVKTKMKIISLALAATFLLPTNSQAQDGSLDLSFGNNGIVTTAIGSDAYGYAMSVQPDGKILVAGTSSDNGTNDNFALVRYNTDGSLDLTFGLNGIVTTNLGSSSLDNATDISIQPDGKILLAGFSGTGANADFALVRYNPNGSLDLSFDSDGIVITPIGNDHDGALAISLQPDGKILLAGWSSYGVNLSNFILIRYNSNGSLDLSFDSDGIVNTSFGNNSLAWAMSLQPDGKILLGGPLSNGTNGTFFSVRYNNDGSLDLSFDVDGKVTTAIGSASGANAMCLQPDGKILLAGTAVISGHSDFALARYNSDGSLDLNFDTDGIVTTAIGSSYGLAYAVSLQPDEKILVAGFSSNGTNNDFTLVRYNSDGSLDLSFDTDGKVVTPISGSNAEAYAMCIQSDGKILLSGYSNGTGNYVFTLARYNNTITAINTIKDSTPAMLVFPNPFNDATTIQFPSTTNNAELSIYNMFGQKVKTISNISDSTISLNRNELSSGFYVVSLTQNKKVVATSKIVVVD